MLLVGVLVWVLLDEVLDTLIVLERELVVDCVLGMLVAELDGETLLDEDDVGCAELEEVWLDDVTYIQCEVSKYLFFLFFTLTLMMHVPCWMKKMRAQS